MSDRDRLIEEVEVKLAMLAERYREQEAKVARMEQTESQLREENQLLKDTIRDMKSAKLFSLGGQDISATRKELNQLIRDVDRCIALLSV